MGSENIYVLARLQRPPVAWGFWDLTAKGGRGRGLTQPTHFSQLTLQWRLQEACDRASKAVEGEHAGGLRGNAEPTQLGETWPVPPAQEPWGQVRRQRSSAHHCLIRSP